MKHIRTFQDLEDNLAELGYSTSMQRQIRPEIRRAARIYRQPLDRIPVDPAAFEARWGRGRISALAEGFATHDEMVRFRRRLGPALQRASGALRRGGFPLPEASQHLLDFVKEHGGVGQRLPPHLAHSVGALARAAARHKKSVADLSPPDVEAIFAELKGNERRSAKRGLLRVNELCAQRAEFPELVSLLPDAPLPEVPRAVAPQSPWARANRDQRGHRLWQDFDQFVAQRRGRDALNRAIPPEKSNFGKAAEDSYAHYLASALALLDRHGRIDGSDDLRLADICNRKVIEEVVRLWNLRQIDGEVKEKASTLHLMVSRLSVMAGHCGIRGKDAKKLRKLRDAVRKAGRVGVMKQEHVQWLSTFAGSPALQRAIFDMPDTLMRQSNRILQDWAAHKTAKRQKLMMQALSFGIAACAAAILFRASPIRAANLRELRFRGENGNLTHSAQGTFRLILPGESVKNGKDVDHEADDDAWPVIAWYLQEIRPRLIRDHPYLRKSRAPIVDSDFLFPSTSGHRALEETSFARHYAQGCEAVGLDMCLHLARHITVYLILSEDPNAWAQAAAMLCDEIGTVKKHYAWLDSRRAGDEGRRLMKQSREKSRKRRMGSSSNGR